MAEAGGDAAVTEVRAVGTPGMELDGLPLQG